MSNDSQEKVLDPALVQISACKDEKSENSGISRRGFLKVIGAASAAGVAGCADPVRQTVFPNLKGDTNQIPGVAVWYKSTCTECSAGCGIDVRTREGRVVKIEGNKDNPINRGGLCGLGQSALQAHYDPDRVRQPLEKSGGSFKAISWEAAYKKVADALKSSKQTAVVHGGQNGAIKNLLEDWNKAFGAESAAFDISAQADQARAAELVFGEYGIPQYSFEKAEVILNFGADFLETWVSPVEFARDWAKRRTPSHPARLIHIEPRLSLTGANADLWISAKPGTENLLALAVLKLLLERGKGRNLSSRVLDKLNELIKDVDVGEVSKRTGVLREKILLIVDDLSRAKTSLVLAGGAASASKDAKSLPVLANLLNLVLSNVGRSVNLAAMRKPEASLAGLRDIIAKLDSGAVDVLLVHGANPAFTLPGAYGFRYAARKAKLKVSFSSHLDETAELADLILPASSSLESWGDSNPRSGVHGLVQPAMKPVFDTRSFGDSLISIARQAGKTAVADGSTDFYSYLRSQWKKLYSDKNLSGGFETFWRKSVERGGYFDTKSSERRVKVAVSDEAFKQNFGVVKFEGKGVGKDGLILYPYFSVRSFDGRAANRPWMQELPDPITRVVWDSWAEINPETAKQHGIRQGDMVTVRNYYGEINVPAYVTEYVTPGTIAVPIGQGHTAYGRFARKVSGGNVLELLAASDDSRESLALIGALVELKKAPGKPNMVDTQGSNSQHGRDLAQTTTVAAAIGAKKVAHGAHDAHSSEGHGGHGAHHHEPKQMYVQRKHPLYSWAMAVDLAACTGCSACVVACYAENNIPVVGKEVCKQGREMSWLRIERYYDGSADELQVSFLPMMCQHCNNAPCEPVCPVYATYHNEEGLNAMVYNRCVGTRYCSNNCTYKVRRFNWFEFDWPEPMNWQLNPDVTKRTAGVMEKCTFCVQRINEAKDTAKDLGRPVEDGDVQPACVQTCPTEALTFGDLNDPNSRVSKLSKESRAYKVLDHHINTQPSVSYLKNIKAV